jgi:hypothetical protein
MKEKVENLKKKAKDLEDILLQMDTGGVESISGEDVLPRLKAISPLDYDKVKAESDDKASDIVESVILMYLPPEFVKNHDYVFQKMEVDKLTVSNLLFQMKTAEHAIKKLLEEIDNGSTHARSFEVLASLQKSKMEIVKHLSSFMVIMENNYKNLKYDYHNNVEKKLDELPPGEVTESNIDDGKKFRGTKGLMNLVQGYMEEVKNKDNGTFESFDEQSENPEQ